jgi:hypothetical protein
MIADTTRSHVRKLYARSMAGVLELPCKLRGKTRVGGRLPWTVQGVSS